MKHPIFRIVAIGTANGRSASILVTPVAR